MTEAQQRRVYLLPACGLAAVAQDQRGSAQDSKDTARDGQVKPQVLGTIAGLGRWAASSGCLTRSGADDNICGVPKLHPYLRG